MDDVNAITALIHEYAFRLDGGDLDGVAALFEHAELRSVQHDRVRRGAAEARTVFDPVVLYDDGTPRTIHQLTNVTVSVDGDDATARSYFTVLQVTRLGLHPVLAGEYRDRFARTSAGWEFRERCFVPILVGDLSEHMQRGAQ
jgi:hypothetical protein